jgi:hypothetical protein
MQDRGTEGRYSQKEHLLKEGLAEHQNRHAIFTTSNCDICIQQG